MRIQIHDWIIKIVRAKHKNVTLTLKMANGCNDLHIQKGEGLQHRSRHPTQTSVP